MKNTTVKFVAVTAAAALALAGCSGAKDDKGSETSTAASTSAAKSVEKSTEKTSAPATSAKEAAAKDASHGEFHLHDGYVKAGKAGGMTAIFGMLENHADKPAHLVGFTTSADAKKNEIHEVVDGKMQEKKDGIIVPAGGHVDLKPGHDHLMLMGLPNNLEAGSTITVTLKFEDGNTVTIKDVPVRQMAAGNESYSGDAEHKHGEHQHGDKKEGEMKMEGEHADHTITQEVPADSK